MTDEKTLVTRIRKIMKFIRTTYCRPNDIPPMKFHVFYLPRVYKSRPYLLPMIGLPSKGCSWMKRGGGCTMCYFGYGFNISDQEIFDAAKWAVYACRYSPEVHITPLGSFFDDYEVSPNLRRGILKLVKQIEYIDLLGTESRVEHIDCKKLEDCSRIIGNSYKLDIGLGFESSNDFVRNVCINKNLNLDDFVECVDLIHSYNFKVSAHVLFKPPFLTESEAIKDAIASIKYCLDHDVDCVVFLPHNMRSKGTLTNILVEKNIFRLPWLWSFLKVLLSLPRKYLRKVRISGFIGNATLKKTAHNCEHCTAHVLSLLEKYCYTMDIKYLHRAMEYNCNCKKTWKKQLNLKLDPLDERVERICSLIEKDLGVVS